MVCLMSAGASGKPSGRGGVGTGIAQDSFPMAAEIRCGEENQSTPFGQVRSGMLDLRDTQTSLSDTVATASVLTCLALSCSGVNLTSLLVTPDFLSGQKSQYSGVTMVTLIPSSSSLILELYPLPWKPSFSMSPLHCHERECVN